MESADLGKSTSSTVVALGGLACPRSHPQIATTTKQTAADLKTFAIAPVVEAFLTNNLHKQKPRRSGQSDRA